MPSLKDLGSDKEDHSIVQLIASILEVNRWVHLICMKTILEMEARKVKKNHSRPAIGTRKRKNSLSNYNNEGKQNYMPAERKVPKLRKTVKTEHKVKNNMVGHETTMKQDKLLINNKNIEGRIVSKQELTNSSILDSASVSHDTSTGLCRFACLDCSSTFSKWVTLQTHEKKVHGKLIHPRDVEAYLFKASVHICLICSKKVLSDSQFFKYHFRSVHNIKLNRYRQQYNCNSAQNIQKTQFNKTIEKAKQSETEIGNFCTFKCPGCKRIFNTYSTFTQHIRPIGGKCRQLEKNIQWKTCLLEVVSHKCKICFKHLLCDNNILLNHVKLVHNIKTISEYAKKTGCSLKNYRHRTDGSHILNLKKATISTEIGNYCTFTCHNCGYSSGNWLRLRKHLMETNHGTSGREWHQHITKVVLHQCKICKKKVLNNKEFVKKHVYKNHQMLIPEYREFVSKV